MHIESDIGHSFPPEEYQCTGSISATSATTGSMTQEALVVIVLAFAAKPVVSLHLTCR
ncbi:MAG: hypothetical protein GXP08_10560 [Gammaproteobacteria bacterium]|nr:hypothetical protein [Gammaproteobacteria bacterium]